MPSELAVELVRNGCVVLRTRSSREDNFVGTSRNLDPCQLLMRALASMMFLKANDTLGKRLLSLF